MNSKQVFVDKNILYLPDEEASKMLESIAYKLHSDYENDSGLDQLILIVTDIEKENKEGICIINNHFFNYSLDKKIKAIKHYCLEKIQKVYKENFN